MTCIMFSRCSNLLLLETSYPFLTVCIWFLTMSAPLKTTYTFGTGYTWFQTLSTPFRNILHLPDCLYLVPNHVYSVRNNLYLWDSLY